MIYSFDIIFYFKEVALMYNNFELLDCDSLIEISGGSISWKELGNVVTSASAGAVGARVGADIGSKCGSIGGPVGTFVGGVVGAAAGYLIYNIF